MTARKILGIVIPSSESNEEVDYFAVRSFAGGGVSKFGAGVQLGRLGYRTAKWAYKRYFRYATRTRSRAAGTGTGAGIGIGGGLVANISSRPKSYLQVRKNGAFMVQPQSKRRSGYNKRICYNMRPTC